ncbi:amino acid ABC transporter permease [Parendozoicomonas sp. Alg238-R29]|uniref:amino acid ABC transporter permease n=1 Tax=Parendozoicomonas sp. Alg238-R29 TaxID=2993446 RepID=UPI00248F2EBD|nr:amino acid ABC transporter permease [Parendozoicomonas sp. Alg238-R29]
MSKRIETHVKQMERQPNALLWHGLFVLIVLAVSIGFYKAAQTIEYSWRWERLPQYFVYEAEDHLSAPFDGEIVLEGERLKLENELDRDQFIVIENLEIVSVSDGDLIFEGDSLGYSSQWTAGPILKGVAVTIELSLYAGVLAIILGTLAGLAKISPNPMLRDFATLYVELIRGTPLLVQIFIVYFFIGTVLDLDRFTAGVIALAVFTGAYVAEIVRSGIESIHKGQMEAGRSLGMTYGQTMRDIILPQAFKRVLPPLAGQFINLIKDSSLVSVISITDLTKAGREVVSSTFSPFEVWLSVALLYLVITGVLSFVVRRLERKYANAR